MVASFARVIFKLLLICAALYGVMFVTGTIAPGETGLLGALLYLGLPATVLLALLRVLFVSREPFAAAAFFIAWFSLFGVLVGISGFIFDHVDFVKLHDLRIHPVLYFAVNVSAILYGLLFLPLSFYGTSRFAMWVYQRCVGGPTSLRLANQVKS